MSLTQAAAEAGDGLARDLDRFDLYMREGFDKVHGWPGRSASVAFMKKFRTLSHLKDIKGGACEIGIHHGKYLIALHNIFEERISIGFDLFDDQARNIDQSGRGSRETCIAHIDKYVGDPHNIKLFARDSLAMSDREIAGLIDEFGNFTFFSIDGGHTPVHVTGDFDIATRMTSPRGIIIVDDLFHPDWPGVTEGLYAILSRREYAFVPFFLTRKKMFLCHISFVKEYRDFVWRNCDGVPKKIVNFAGYEALSLNFGSEY